MTQPAPAVVEFAAQAGLDFVRIDAYDGRMNAETVDALIRAGFASNVTPMVRVANDRLQVLSALESGAMAITVPDVEIRETALDAVRAVRLPTPRATRDQPACLGDLGPYRGAFPLGRRRTHRLGSD